MSDLRPAVALIGYAGQRYHGTAWLISEQLAVTAAHCVGDRLRKTLDPRRLALRFLKPTEQTVAVAEVLLDEKRECFDYDVALLKLGSPMAAAQRRPLPLSRFVADDERWTGYGFPEAHPSGYPLSGTVTSTLGNVVVDALQLTLDQGGHGFMEGSSGSPVLVGGCAVGVIRYHPPLHRAATIHATSIADLARIYPQVAALFPPPVDPGDIAMLAKRLEGLEGGLFENILGEIKELLGLLALHPEAPALLTVVSARKGDRRAVIDYLLRYCPTGLRPVEEALRRRGLPLRLESSS